MFEVVSPDEVRVSVRHPLVYLDHCAIRRISSSATRRARLREIFSSRGTLMFSVLNMLEMARNTGASYENIRDMLDELGPHCIPTDADLATVESREQQGLRSPAAFLAVPEMLAQIVKAMPSGQVKFGTAFEVLHDRDFRDRAPELLEHADMLRDLHLYRERARRGEKMLPLPKPTYSLRWIEISLIRRLLRDSKNMSGNDINDVFHAVMPLGYADIVVLDSAWANYARGLKIPRTHVFAATEEGLDATLECIRTLGSARQVAIDGKIAPTRGTRSQQP